MSATTGSSDKREIRLDYMPHLIQPLMAPLLRDGKEGVDPVLSFMESYGLTK